MKPATRGGDFGLTLALLTSPEGKCQDEKLSMKQGLVTP